MKHLLLLSAVVLLLASVALPAEPGQHEIRITTDATDFQAAIGQNVTFRFSLIKDGQPIIGDSLSYRLSWDNLVTVSEGKVESAAEPASVAGLATHPGFLMLRVAYTPAGGEEMSEAVSIAVAPRQIISPVTEPADFQAFWAAKKKLVLDEPMKPELTPVERDLPGCEVFDLQINCPGVKPCSGYFARPKNAAKGSLPAVLFLHSAGVWSSWIATTDWAARHNVLTYDLNAHGIPNGREREFYEALDKGELKDYCFAGNNDREKMYFLGMYMRIVRAIQFLTSQPEWDGQNLIVVGGSKGGGQAIIAAGLDERVTFVAARLPALANQTGFLAGQPAGWPRTVFHGDTPQMPIKDYDRTVADVSRYFDAVNFARHCRAEVIIGVGWIDTVCPATSIYGMFNAIPGDAKTMVDFPAVSHFKGSKEMEPKIDEMVGEYIKRHRVK